MIRFTDADVVTSELQTDRLKKRASLLASEAQTPVLLLAREVVYGKHHKDFLLRFPLYLKSPYDQHFTLVKLFYKLEDFCLWYVSRHPYREFEFINYSQV